MTDTPPDNPAIPPGPPASAPGPSAAPPRKRRLRWHIARWAVRACVGGLLLGVLGVLLLMRSPVVGRMVREQLATLTDARLDAGAIYLSIDGRLVIDKPVLRVPGIDGPAGEVVSAERIVVDLDWRRWRQGDITPTALRLESPVLRVSQSLDDQSINLAGLAPKRPAGAGGTGAGGAGGAGAPRPPQIDLIDGKIEFAEYSPNRAIYRTIHTIQAAGSLVPVDAAKGIYNLRLQEIGRAPPVAPGPRGMVLDGRLDLLKESYTLRLLNLPLDAFPADAVPMAYRDTWRRLAVQGRVTESAFTYSKTEGIRLEMSLAGVGISIPVPDYNPDAPMPDTLSISDVNGKIGLSNAGLSADLTGLVKGQSTPSRVRLETKGLELTSGLRCEITGRNLSIDKNPAFFPYVPDKVKEYFAYFSGPTVQFDARVVIVRDSPAPGQTEPAPIHIADGRLVFRNGTAAFHKFPYPFQDMSGTVEFTESSLRFVDIVGRGPTGSVMSATAAVEPLTDDAEVRVSVKSLRTPIDPFLLDSMPVEDRRVLETLFSREDYDRLVANNLVISSGEHAIIERDVDDLRGLLSDALGQRRLYRAQIERLQRALAVLEPRLRLPVFDLAGDADISVEVFSPRGKDQPFTVDVNVKFPEAGLLPEPFPYPINAQNLSFLVTPERAELVSGDLRGLRGGTAKLSAEVQLEIDGQRVVQPDIRVGAFDIPVDDLLVAALPDTASAAAAGAPQVVAPDEAFVGPPTRPLTPQVICQTLDVRGTIDAGAVISFEPGDEDADGSDRITYEATVTLDRITAGPPMRGGPEVRLMNLRGSMDITPERVSIEDLRADLRRLDTPPPERGPVAPDAGTLAARLRVDLVAGLDQAGADAPTPPGVVHLDLGATDVDLSAPAERLAALFSADAGTFLTNLRADLDPAGQIDARLGLDYDPHAAKPSAAAWPDADRPVTTRYELAFSRIRDVSAQWRDGRLLFSSFDTQEAPPDGASDDAGAAPDAIFRVVGEDEDRLTFSAHRAKIGVRYDGDQVGVATADGRMTYLRESGLFTGPSDFEASISGVRTESALVRSLVLRALPEEAQERFESLDFRGTFDVFAKMTGAESPGAIPARVSGQVFPRALSFDDGTGRVDITSLSGCVDFRAAQTDDHARWRAAGNATGIELQAEDLSALLAGQWSYSRSLGLSLDADIDIKAESLTARHEGLLPESVRSALGSIEARIEGPWSLSPARLVLQTPGEPDESPGRAGIEARRAPNQVTFDAGLAFSRGSLNLGVPMTDADGRARIRVFNTDDRGPNFEIELQGADLRIAGAGVENARALITSRAASDAVDIAYATASCHGGRVWASGQILSNAPGEGPGPATLPALEAPGPRAGVIPADLSAVAGAEDHHAAPGASAWRSTYRADVILAGVAFAPLLEELRSGDERAVLGSDESDRHAAAERPIDQSRGLVDAWFSLQGTPGEVDSRVGRGAIRIASGNVLRLPVVFQLMQISNFALPSPDELDYLQATFHLGGATARFDNIALLSDSIALLGSGNVRFPDLDLDLTFNSRGVRRLPLLSDLFEMVRNEVATTRITGTLAEPDIQSVPLVGTGRALSNLFNPGRRTDDPMSPDEFRRVVEERRRFQALLTPDRRAVEPTRAGAER